jgi:hypothetical protein
MAKSERLGRRRQTDEAGSNAKGSDRSLYSSSFRQRTSPNYQGRPSSFESLNGCPSANSEGTSRSATGRKRAGSQWQRTQSHSLVFKRASFSAMKFRISGDISNSFRSLSRGQYGHCRGRRLSWHAAIITGHTALGPPSVSLSYEQATPSSSTLRYLEALPGPIMSSPRLLRPSVFMRFRRASSSASLSAPPKLLSFRITERNTSGPDRREAPRPAKAGRSRDALEVEEDALLMTTLALIEEKRRGMPVRP